MKDRHFLFSIEANGMGVEGRGWFERLFNGV